MSWLEKLGRWNEALQVPHLQSAPPHPTRRCSHRKAALLRQTLPRSTPSPGAATFHVFHAYDRCMPNALLLAPSPGFPGARVHAPPFVSQCTTSPPWYPRCMRDRVTPLPLNTPGVRAIPAPRRVWHRPPPLPLRPLRVVSALPRGRRPLAPAGARTAARGCSAAGGGAVALPAVDGHGGGDEADTANVV